jgi:hypothetical protein
LFLFPYRSIGLLMAVCSVLELRFLFQPKEREQPASMRKTRGVGGA